MTTEHATGADQEERPPLGSDEAISAVVEAIGTARRNEELWDGDLFGFRRQDLKSWPLFLHLFTPLYFQPHYLEVIEALRELSWVRVSGPGRLPKPEDLDNPEIEKTYPEDFFKEYVAEVRRRELEQRRRLAARRRQGY